MVSRDTLGSAVKCTYVEIDSVGYDIEKNPITDLDKTKKSAKGLLRVDINESGDFVLKDCCTKEEASGGELKPLFKDGEILREVTFTEIRNRLWGN